MQTKMMNYFTEKSEENADAAKDLLDKMDNLATEIQNLGAVFEENK